MALVIYVAHRTELGAESWIDALGARGHLARPVDPDNPCARPGVLDALLVDAHLPAAAVDSLRRWAGPRVAVRLCESEPEDEWLSELVRTASQPLKLGECTVDLRRGVVTRDVTMHTLTDIEALLLAWLATQRGTVVSRGDLLEHVWGYRPNMRTRVVDVTIARLRAKIEREPREPEHIITVRGKGYRLDGLERASVRQPAEPVLESPELLGRESDVSLLRGWVSKGDTLITVLGPPGIGKTTLAQFLQRTTPNARWCSLQAVATDAEVLIALAEALGIQRSSPEEQVRQALLLGERPLLVIDNIEHVQGILGRLLTEAPTCPILLTSRVRLGVSAERCLDLSPLSASYTQALFLDRARRQRADFTSEPEVLETLARLCEGLPLAVELAAAQVGVLSASDLVRVLSTRSVRARHRKGYQSYDDALHSSWTLLTESDRHMLSRLAFLRGDLPVALLDSLFDDPVEGLGALQDASLIRIHHGTTGASVHLLETVRRFVQRTAPLSDSEGVEVARQVAAHIQRVHHQARTSEGAVALRALGQLRLVAAGVIEIALNAHATDVANDVVTGLTHYYEFYGGDASILASLRRVVHSPDPYFHTVMLLALLLGQTGRVRDAAPHVQRCVDLATDEGERAEAVYVQSMIRGRRQHFDVEALERAIPKLPGPVSRCRAHGALAIMARREERQAEVVAHLERALAEADKTGIPWLQLGTLHVLATSYARHGEAERARLTAETIGQMYEEHGLDANLEMMLPIRRFVQLATGDIDGAQNTLRQLLTLLRSFGRSYALAHMLCVLAQTHIDQGEFEAAERSILEARRLNQAVDDAAGVGEAEAMLACLDLCRGKADEAYEGAMAQLQNPRGFARSLALETAFYAALDQGDRAKADAALAEAPEADPRLRGLLTAALARLRGAPLGDIPAQAAPDEPRRAVACLLQGTEGTFHTRRAQAVFHPGDIRFPEAPLILALASQG